MSISMSIDVARTDDALRVRFPIELNPAFKSQFTTARWDPDARAWEIKNRPQNDAKLQRWIAEVEASNVLETLRLDREIERDDLDWSRLQSELGQLRRQVERALQEIQRRAPRPLGLALGLRRVAPGGVQGGPGLGQRRRDFGQPGGQVARALDLAAVRAAHETMKRYCRQVGSPAKDRYRDAQTTVCRERERLAAAGFRSRGLDALAGANFNRPDRDDPGQIGLDDLLDLRPFTPPEEPG